MFQAYVTFLCHLCLLLETTVDNFPHLWTIFLIIFYFEVGGREREGWRRELMPLVHVTSSSQLRKRVDKTFKGRWARTNDIGKDNTLFPFIDVWMVPATHVNTLNRMSINELKKRIFCSLARKKNHITRWFKPLKMHRHSRFVFLLQASFMLPWGEGSTSFFAYFTCYTLPTNGSLKCQTSICEIPHRLERGTTLLYKGAETSL